MEDQSPTTEDWPYTTGDLPHPSLPNTRDWSSTSKDWASSTGELNLQLVGYLTLCNFYENAI